jgi:hypothetical protein
MDGSRSPAVRVIAWTLAVLALVAGTLLRSWLLVHVPIDGDEAIVGLMARRIDAGHVVVFYWGQSYGGGEPYFVAAAFKVLAPSPLVLNATASLLALVGALLSGAIVTEVTTSRLLGALGAAMTWVWPFAVIFNSVREVGFRQVTLICGLTLILMALRVARGRRTQGTCIVLGLAAGVGWWSSPEILYFAVPAAILLVGSLNRWDKRVIAGAGHDVRGVALVAAAAVVGAAPWLVTNVRHGFVSLRASGVPAQPGIGYLRRLSIFVHHVVGIELGTNDLTSGRWVSGAVGGVLLALAVVLIVAALARAAWGLRLGRTGLPLAAIAAGVLTLPFLYAANPATWFWQDGRYGIFLPPLLVCLLLGALGAPRPPAALPEGGPPGQWAPPTRRGVERLATATACVGLCGLVVLGAVGAHESLNAPVAHPSAFFSGWGDPETGVRQTVLALRAAGIDDAYASYNTAYVLDFLGPALSVSPSNADLDRTPSVRAAVAKVAHPAWLFYAPNRLHLAINAFQSVDPGPGGYAEAAFISLLRANAIGYRVVHLDLLDAVIPAAPVQDP